MSLRHQLHARAEAVAERRLELGLVERSRTEDPVPEGPRSSRSLRSAVPSRLAPIHWQALEQVWTPALERPGAAARGLHEPWGVRPGLRADDGRAVRVGPGGGAATGEPDAASSASAGLARSQAPAVAAAARRTSN